MQKKKYDMEKRLAVALVLCLLWIVLAQLWLVPKQTPQEKDATRQDLPFSSESMDQDADSPGGAGSPSVDSAEIDDGSDFPDADALEGTYDHTESLSEERFEVDTDIYRVCFTNHGAALISLKLKTFFNEPEVLHDPEAMAMAENWLEIMKEVREGTPSFTLREMANPKFDLDKVCWEHELISSDLGSKKVVFTFRDSSGLVFRKVFSLYPGAYHLDLRLEVENRNPDLTQKLNMVLETPCGIPERKRAALTQGPMAVLYTLSEDRGGRDFEVKTLPAAELSRAPHTWSRRQDNHLIFAGIADNYFALLLQPTEGTGIKQVSLQALENSSMVETKLAAYESQYGGPPPPRQLAEIKQEARTNVESDFMLGFNLPAPGETTSQSFLFYAGPKSTELMQRPEYRNFYVLIEDSYGMMAWINKSLIWILQFFHSIVKNWGLSIIFLTFLVKLILFPLNRFQQVSMHAYTEKMKKLKPKLDEIKKKYKNNKKKFNEAQMKLMKEEGLRPPLMGCLIMFLQLPVFYSLFQVLRTSIELRHSPFCLWIKDLSQPDALCSLPFTIPFLGWDMLNILPLGMTVAFYYQQKMMPKPTATDPQAEQMQKIMKFLPIFFGFLLYNYAAGLSLYWMTSNLITIFEYKVIRKKFPISDTDKAKA
ncbi:MAG: membrane protein insertase YidC [Planctomycetes bacterium]|nr:membrane protein insertase YidC [Planctomycetota bacterium]